jgi:hypothetical protein
VRVQPSVKLKIDRLRTSMGSCLRARGRKILRSVLLKLFSRGFVFIVYEILTQFCPLTTKHLRGFSVPLSREDVSLAKSAGAC